MNAVDFSSLPDFADAAELEQQAEQLAAAGKAASETASACSEVWQGLSGVRRLYPHSGLFVLDAGITAWDQGSTQYNADKVEHPEWSSGQRALSVTENVAIVGGASLATGAVGALGGAKAGAVVEGLVTGEGRLVASPLDGELGSVHFTAGLGGAKSTFYCALGREGVLVLAGASCARMRRDEQAGEDRQVDFLTLDQLFPALAAWLGLGPSWHLDDEVRQSPGIVQARLAGASPAEVPAPEGAGEVVRHMWDQDWFIWQQVGGTGTLPTGIQAGSAGTWQLLRAIPGCCCSHGRLRRRTAA